MLYTVAELYHDNVQWCATGDGEVEEAYSVDDLVENWRHVADVVHVKYRVEELPLSAVVLSCEETFSRCIVSYENTHLVKKARQGRGIFDDTCQSDICQHLLSDSRPARKYLRPDVVDIWISFLVFENDVI